MEAALLALLSLLYAASLCLSRPLAVPGAGFLTLNRAFEQRGATLCLLPPTVAALVCVAVPQLRQRRIVLGTSAVLFALALYCLLWYGMGPALIYALAAGRLYQSNRAPA